MLVKQYVFTLTVIHREPDSMPELAVATALIADDEEGGNALPMTGPAAVRGMAGIIAIIASSYEKGGIVFVDGVSNGRDIAELRDQAIAEAMARGAGELGGSRIIVPTGTLERADAGDATDADVLPRGGGCDICGAPLGELHDPACPRLVAQGERVS